MSDSVTVVYVNHTAEHSPNDVVTISEAQAARLVEAGMVRVVTDADDLEASVQAELADATATAPPAGDEAPVEDVPKKK